MINLKINFEEIYNGAPHVTTLYYFLRALASCGQIPCELRDAMYVRVCSREGDDNLDMLSSYDKRVDVQIDHAHNYDLLAQLRTSVLVAIVIHDEQRADEQL